MAIKTSMVRCLDCKHGAFMQWFHNPIVCQCDALEERMVAEAHRMCSFYVQRNSEPEIKHYDHYED